MLSVAGAFAQCPTNINTVTLPQSYGVSAGAMGPHEVVIHKVNGVYAVNGQNTFWMKPVENSNYYAKWNAHYLFNVDAFRFLVKKNNVLMHLSPINRDYAQLNPGTSIMGYPC